VVPLLTIAAPLSRAIYRRQSHGSGVSGAAVAVIQDDEVTDLRGFGVKELGGPQPVTPRHPVHDRLHHQTKDAAFGYDAALQQRVLSPIGTNRSTFDREAVRGDGDYALPHAADLSGDLRPIPLEAFNSEAHGTIVSFTGGVNEPRVTLTIPGDPTGPEQTSVFEPSRASAL